MDKISVFNEQQVEALELARREGGIFLKLYQNHIDPVEVIKNDEKGNSFTMSTLDKGISSKIYDLHKKDALYKAPLEDGAYMISLAWFVVEYC